MSRQIFFVFFLFFIYASNAQNMTQGFGYLENGNYQKAKGFFEDILNDFPDNRTAKLCYGRAVGLLGESEKAILIFTELKEVYPNDFEIKLNYAESLLWNKNYQKAETYYQKLVKKNPDNFAATLGYANTLSNLKEYSKALEMVNKALKITPDNPNAIISRKYIRLGYAFTLAQNKEYDEALKFLNKNLIDFPDDRDTLLNKANIFLIIENYPAAEDTYHSLAISPKDSIIALNGLSLVAHKRHNEKKALNFATLALEKTRKLSPGADVDLAAKERYIQALLWNRKFKNARIAIDRLKSEYPENSRISSLQATFGMYTSDFSSSLEFYHSILASDVKSFDGNLGIANAYRAIGSDMQAYQYAYKTLTFYPKQPDAEKLIATLKKSHMPFIENKTALTFDNGNNEAKSTKIHAEIPLSPQLVIKGQYSYRSTENTIADIKAESNEASVGINYKFNGRFILKTIVGLNNSNAETSNYTGMIAEAILSTKPTTLQNLDIGYKREFQNFNADLIDREIAMNNYSLNYNLGTNINLGWYTQAMYTSQSDKNTRNLLFTSLYYTLLNRPVLKVGLNYQYISFKNQVPLIYFSPSSFNLFEFFGEILNDPNQNWFYGLSAAVGRQYVENDSGSTTFRAEGKVGHHVSERFKASVYGKYSNIASATAAGFEFIEIGINLKWYFLDKPTFNKKIMNLKTNSENQK